MLFIGKFSFPKRPKKKGSGVGAAKKVVKPKNNDDLPDNFTNNGGRVNLKALNQQRIRNMNNR